MFSPAAFNDGMASGGGTSIQSTWPERSAATRVVASGIGYTTILSSFGMRALSQYASLRDISAYCPSTTLVILNGPVPEGCCANAAQLLPTFSHCVGLTIRMRVSRYGRKLNGYLVVRTMVLSSAFSNLSTIDTVALTIGAAGASYCGALSS